MSNDLKIFFVESRLEHLFQNSRDLDFDQHKKMNTIKQKNCATVLSRLARIL